MKQGDSMGEWWPVGTRVKASNLDNGWPFDRERARNYLTLGESYTVKSSRAGRDWSDVELSEIPGVIFNTVHFTEAK